MSHGAQNPPPEELAGAWPLIYGVVAELGWCVWLANPRFMPGAVRLRPSGLIRFQVNASVYIGWGFDRAGGSNRPLKKYGH